MTEYDMVRAMLMAPLGDEPGEPRVIGRGFPCVVIDHRELPLKDLLVQVECATCGKWYLEGGNFPCGAGHDELPDD